MPRIFRALWLPFLILVPILLDGSPLVAQNKDRAKDSKKKLPSSDVSTSIEKAKAATALVNLKDHRSGSAFCISSDRGLFLTNRHVVQNVNVGDSVELVLNSGEKNERQLQAKVVHRSEDQDVDLALLKTEPLKDQPSLKLGDDKGLKETAAVNALGFPFGRALLVEGQRFPNVTVTPATVSALRKVEKGLAVIQVDGALNPGCSGGPLLDKQGQVVGVVFAAVPLSGIAFAVPISKVHEYLKPPRAVLTQPHVLYSKRFEPQSMQIEVVELTASSESTSVDLILQSEQGDPPRTIPTKKNGNLYEVSAILFSKPIDEPPLRLIIARGRTSIEATTTDQSVKFGETSMRLSDCRQIEHRAGMFIVTSVENKKIATQSVQLPVIELDDGTKERLELADRIDIAFNGPADSEVSYEVQVRRANEVVTTEFGVIHCSDSPRRVPGDYWDVNDMKDEHPKELTILAAIDGKSTLYISSNGLWWQHEEDGLPGTKEGERSYVMVNGRRWYLRWHNDGNGKFRSEVLPLNIGGLWHEASLLSIRERPDAPNSPHRGRIEFHQGPNFNDLTTVTFIDPPGGNALYNLQLFPKVDWSLPTAVHERTKPPTSALWNFDQDTPEKIHDVTGNGHDGHGPAPSFVAGKFGQALSFDGASVNCGNIGDFERTDAISLGGWVYCSRTTGMLDIAARMDGRVGYRGYDLCAGTHLYFQLLHDAPSGNGVKVFSNERLEPFRWYHFFATYDGSGTSNGVRLYIDGQPIEFAVEMDRLTETTKVDVPFRIGSREPNSPAPDPMRGIVDEVRLYHRVLTAHEVRNLALASQPGLGAEEPSSLRDQLVGAWLFDNPQQAAAKTTTILDSGQGHHNGTIEPVRQDITIVSGKFKKALSLNNQAIELEAVAGDFERTDAFSLGCWVQRTEKPNQPLFSKIDHRPPYRGYDLTMQDGKPRLNLTCNWDAGFDEPQNALLINGQTAVPSKEWHHVLVTYDGSSKATGVTIYVDGKPIPTQVESDSLTGSIRTATPLRLGHRFNEPAAFFDGLMDECVMYARCLSGEEVKQLLSDTPPPP